MEGKKRGKILLKYIHPRLKSYLVAVVNSFLLPNRIRHIFTPRISEKYATTLFRNMNAIGQSLIGGYLW